MRTYRCGNTHWRAGHGGDCAGWWAVCPCGWTAEYGDRTRARWAAVEHEREETGAMVDTSSNGWLRGWRPTSETAETNERLAEGAPEDEAWEHVKAEIQRKALVKAERVA